MCVPQPPPPPKKMNRSHTYAYESTGSGMCPHKFPLPPVAPTQFSTKKQAPPPPRQKNLATQLQRCKEIEQEEMYRMGRVGWEKVREV